MKKNIVIINGATRKNGNTDIIINTIIKGAVQDNINIIPVTLRKKEIKDCTGCNICSEKQECALKDDMAEILLRINESDLLIFASPVYFWGVTGIMKIFIDRLYFYYSEKNKRLLSGKRAMVIAPMNMKQDNYKTKIFTEFFTVLFDNLELIPTEIVYFDDINKKGEVVHKPEYLQRALDIGKNL